MAVEFSQNQLDVVIGVCLQRYIKGTHDITVPCLSKEAMESLQMMNPLPIEITRVVRSYSERNVRECQQESSTEFSLGPLIDQFPCNPDTVLTTLLFVKVY